jgi:hypothetical protein
LSLEELADLTESADIAPAQFADSATCTYLEAITFLNFERRLVMPSERGGTGVPLMPNPKIGGFMVEKQVSSEIAQSRARFLKWQTHRERITMTRPTLEVWEQAERDTRELVAQIAREYLKLWPTMAVELAERIGGKE